MENNARKVFSHSCPEEIDVVSRRMRMSPAWLFRVNAVWCDPRGVSRKLSACHLILCVVCGSRLSAFFSEQQYPQPSSNTPGPQLPCLTTVPQCNGLMYAWFSCLYSPMSTCSSCLHRQTQTIAVVSINPLSTLLMFAVYNTENSRARVVTDATIATILYTNVCRHRHGGCSKLLQYTFDKMVRCVL